MSLGDPSNSTTSRPSARNLTALLSAVRHYT